MTPEQLDILRELAASYGYGRGPDHAKQVCKLSLEIYYQLGKLDMLNKQTQGEGILEATALLHDVGLPEEPHNEAAFDLLSIEIPKLMTSKPLSLNEFTTILYCILWHRGNVFSERGTAKIVDPSYTKKMAAIVRVADALDRRLRQPVGGITLELVNHCLLCRVLSDHSIEKEIQRAGQKGDLMKEAYDLTEVSFEAARN